MWMWQGKKLFNRERYLYKEEMPLFTKQTISLGIESIVLYRRSWRSLRRFVFLISPHCDSLVCGLLGCILIDPALLIMYCTPPYFTEAACIQTTGCCRGSPDKIYQVMSQKILRFNAHNSHPFLATPARSWLLSHCSRPNFGSDHI